MSVSPNSANKNSNLLYDLISNWENETIEFKEASKDYDTDKIGRYVSALSNEAVSYTHLADACTGCKKCITEIGCPGIGFDGDARGWKSKERGQAFVDASLCNGCGLCTQVCPFGALGVPPARCV